MKAEKSEEEELGERAKFWTRLYSVAIFMAIFIPIIMVFLLPWGAECEGWRESLQRSGGITVALALFAEFAVVGLHQAITPAGLASKWTDPIRKKYRNHPRLMSCFALGVTVIGTLNSSYGDLIPFKSIL